MCSATLPARNVPSRSAAQGRLGWARGTALSTAFAPPVNWTRMTVPLTPPGRRLRRVSSAPTTVATSSRTSAGSSSGDGPLRSLVTTTVRVRRAPSAERRGSELPLLSGGKGHSWGWIPPTFRGSADSGGFRTPVLAESVQPFRGFLCDPTCQGALCDKWTSHAPGGRLRPRGETRLLDWRAYDRPGGAQRFLGPRRTASRRRQQP